MKPITLKLSGLHSYRDLQVINFEELCAAGLFGIFGPTGSGKSTILDAITLALYGQVVRTGGGSHPQQVLNQLERRVFVSFTFELGSVEKRQRYTVEREYGLDKKGNKRPPEVRLIRCSLDRSMPDQVLESKASSGTAAIEQLIGLTIHDFTRAVILPQGQFSKFLTLKGSERNEMLQRIFHLQEYGEQLNERIRIAFEQNKQRLHQMEIQLASVGNAGPEALKQAELEFQLAAAQQKQMEQEFSALTNRKQELEQLRAWLAEQERIQREIVLLRSQAEEAERLGRLVKEIEASVELWPLAQKLQALEDEVRQTETLLGEQREDLQASSLQQAEAEQLYQSLQQRLRTDEPQMIEQKSKLAQAMLWEQELVLLEQEIAQFSAEHQQMQAELAEIEGALAKKQQQLAALETELTDLDRQLQMLAVTPETRKQLRELLEAKTVYDRELLSFQESEVDVQDTIRQLDQMKQRKADNHARWQASSKLRDSAGAELQRLEELQVPDKEIESQREQLAELKEIGARWRELTIKLSDWNLKWQACDNSLASRRQQLQSLEGQLNRAQANLANQQQTKMEAEREYSLWQRADMARTLRMSLAEGEPCPVCGSAHHSLQHQADSRSTDEVRQTEQKLMQTIRACEQAVAEAEQAVRTAQEALHAAKVDHAGEQTRASSLRDDKKLLDHGVLGIQAELEAFGADWAASSVDDLLGRYRQAYLALQEQVSVRDNLRGQMEEARETAARLREQEYMQKSAFEQDAAVCGQLEQKLAQASARLADRAAKLVQAQKLLDQLRGEWNPDTVTSDWQRLEEQDAASRRLQGQRAELEEQKKQTQQAAQAMQEKRTGLAIREVTSSQRLVERQGAYAQKRGQWLQITGGASAAQLADELHKQLGRLRQDFEAAEQSREAAGRLRQQLQDQLTQTEVTHAQLVRRKDEAAAAFELAAIASNLQDLPRIASLYQEKSKLPAFEEKIQTFFTKEAQVQYALEKVSEKLAGRTVDAQEWQTVQDTWQELEHLVRQSQDQVAVAREFAAKVMAGHERWKLLQQVQVGLLAEQSRLEELRKLFEGKAFVQFIAEEKLATIARDASYHLARMTKNRYALEIGADGEFVLRDEGMGGMRRPVTTLSGGETFLTALSLALALSVEIQMRGGKLEFFFLDEGFGTLDPELLEIVLDALERLRMDEFAIGLISHVPELRMRMPRRLVVTPAQAMGAGSQIVMEME